MNKKNVLFVGAHPDDVEIGCGGTIYKHLKRGDSVFILIMSHGEKGNHPFGLIECLNSLKLLGVKEKNIILGNFPDGYIKDDLSTVSFIENQITKFNIDRIYAHYCEDNHQDHRNCSNATSAAARRKVKEILLFQGPSTKVTFEPHYFIGLSEENLVKKINSLKCYETQIKKGVLNIEVIKATARLHGFNNNSPYAEAFGINHVFRGEDEI
jgi:LmbE family N-acetylglucosaminyl deacetylase